MIKKYIKKPLSVEAVQFIEENMDDVAIFLKNYDYDIEFDLGRLRLKLYSHEDEVFCYEGGYLIKGIDGEIYPCKKFVFEESYTEVKEISPSKSNTSNKSKFRLKDYQGDYVMHCDTEEKAKIFCKFLDDNGRTWYNAVRYVRDNNWNVCKNKTCYYFNHGIYGAIICVEKKYTILEFDDFDWEE